MQLLLLALALGIFAYDALVARPLDAAPFPPAVVLAGVVVPKLVVAGLYAAACAHVLKRLKTARGPRLVRRLDRLTSALQYAALALYALDLYLGLLPLVRAGVGDLVLVDELLVMLPTLALLVSAWWAYHPIDSALRDASLIARIDAGLPVYRIWTRSQYIIAQLRHQVALILAPLLVIMAWLEIVDRYVPASWPPVAFDPRPAAVLAGAAAIFVLAPVMLRYLWDTTPLPRGEIRDTLTRLCRRHRVRVRELLLWRTFGGMINAAVMGVAGPVRYILLTDALLDMLERRQVEAVMAHELAHVRKGHMPWMLGAAVATLGLLETAAHAAIAASRAAPTTTAAPTLVTAGWSTDLLAHPYVLDALAMGVAIGGWVMVFGWVSRRLERQADAFAVRSLATDPDDDANGVGGTDAASRATVDAASVAAMVTALQQVAELNHIPVRRRSWRHGSIAWRQAYLRTLIGRRVDDLPIDRQVRLIKLAVAVGLAALLAASLLLPPTLRPALLLGI